MSEKLDFTTLATRTMLDPSATAGEFQYAVECASQVELRAAAEQIGEMIARLETRNLVLRQRRDELEQESPACPWST